MSHQAEASETRLADIFFTIILCVCAGFVSAVLILFALVWAGHEGDADNWAIALGIVGPVLVTLVGVVSAVVRVLRGRRGWRVALLTIAGSIFVWWLASLLAAG
ncbi:hypothetical protein ABZ477_02840 [Microbacterium sp. NPDC019599]|uniref:hypothetical protein n=1 Tax=Microbacterium sp. NPDC019599 TaxID=3154690 RepID=UPI0033C0A83C